MSRSIAQRRLRSQRMTGGQMRSPAEVVDWLLAVQAQDVFGSSWGIGQRMRDATDAVIERAFQDGQLLRTHVLRPTWHFVLPSDIRWLLMLTGPRVQVQNGSMYRKLELTPDVLNRAANAMARAVEGGNYATRNDLRAVLEAEGISTAGPQRMTYLVMNAELEGVLCSGPRKGRQFTYALLDERAAPRTMDRDEALVELTRRYFESRGPATVHDLAKWSGLTIADARKGLDACSSLLEKESVDGVDYWFGAEAAADDSGAHDVFLLSVYDEYLSAYRGRSAMISPAHAARLVGQGNALYYVLVVDTQIVGTWKREDPARAVPEQPLEGQPGAEQDGRVDVVATGVADAGHRRPVRHLPRSTRRRHDGPRHSRALTTATTHYPPRTTHPMRPFRYHATESALHDLASRLARVRWPDEVEGSGWDYGTNLGYLQRLIAYWRSEYDWRLWEESLNEIPQFVATLDGLDVHFIYVKGKGPNPLPLVLTHGWPSTCFELRGLIGPLTDPASHGGDAADSFDVVIPSLPGFGFSSRPSQRGFLRVDNLWRKLMTETLGYGRFVAHGTDVGARVTSALGRFHADVVQAIHIGSVDLEWPDPMPKDADLSDAERDYVARVRR